MLFNSHGPYSRRNAGIQRASVGAYNFLFVKEILTYATYKYSQESECNHKQHPESNCCTAALKQQDVVPNLAGNGFVVIGQSTSRMRVNEFAELLELIQAFGTERGVKWSDEARLALEWKARWGDRAA